MFDELLRVCGAHEIMWYSNNDAAFVYRSKMGLGFISYTGAAWREQTSNGYAQSSSDVSPHTTFE